MATIALGAVVRIVNGVLVAFFRVPAFVATLGSLCVARGVVLLMTNRPTFNNLSGNSALGNTGFAWLGFNRLGGVAIGVIALAIIALAAGLLLSRTACGRWSHSSGGNARAAELSGSAAWAAGEKGPISIIVNDPANPYWFTEGQVAKKTTEDLGQTATVSAHEGDANVESNLVDAAITNDAIRSNGYKTVLSQYQGLVNRTRDLQARGRRGGLRPQGIPREAGSERNLEKALR